MAKLDGGPAFPRTVQHYNEYLEGRDGMSLRDWFAGKAIAGLLVANIRVPLTYYEYAERAYKVADAMLAEREKAGGER